MSRINNYSKWDHFGEDDDSFKDIDDFNDEAGGSLGALKLKADEIFQVAECSGDPYDYKLVLNEGYLVVLLHIKEMDRIQKNATDVINHLEVACKLNSACCYLRLMQWNETIRECSDVLIDHFSILNQEQELRSRYFRSYANFKIGSADSFLRAEDDAKYMAALISSPHRSKTVIGKEYVKHFQTLREEKMRLESVDQRARIESDISLNSKEGWALYSERKYEMSSIWFVNQLLKVEMEYNHIPNAKSALLCNLYNGLGESNIALNNYSEAAKAFSAVAMHSEMRLKKRDAYLEAAALYVKSSDYQVSISSYTSVLLLTEDAKDSSVSPSSTDDFHDDTASILAIANAGLGACYLKLQDYEKAVNYLKEASGLMTDTILMKKQERLPIILNLMKRPKSTKVSLDMSRIMSFTSASNKISCLLNTLESLTDSYAALYDWEKTNYTANIFLEFCDAVLDIMRGVTKDSVKESKLGSSLKLKIFVITALEGSSATSGREPLNLERDQYILTIRRRRAMILLSKGHIIQRILQYDINRTDNIVILDKRDDADYKLPAIDNILGRETLFLSPKKSADIEDNSTECGLSAIDTIITLWTEVAIEFDSLGNINTALSVFKNLAAIWENISRAQPYSRSLIDIDYIPLETQPEDREFPSSFSPENERKNLITPHDNDIADESVLFSRPSFPLHIDSEENRSRIDAAKKGSEVWKCAATVAQKMCNYAVNPLFDSKAENFCSEGLSGKNKTVESLSFKTETVSMSSEHDEEIRLVAELVAWQQVMCCHYNAGICDMMYDMEAAQEQFKIAQEIKITYGLLAVSLADIESENSVPVKNIEAQVVTDNFFKDMSDYSEKKYIPKLPVNQRNCCIDYNSLCCDISYHLGHTYLRTNNIAYAIAEAEMAIGFALFSDKRKIRRTKGLGLLALAMSAGGQILEVKKALKDINTLCRGHPEEAEKEINQIRLSLEFWTKNKNKRKLIKPNSIDKKVVNKNIWIEFFMKQKILISDFIRFLMNPTPLDVEVTFDFNMFFYSTICGVVIAIVITLIYVIFKLLHRFLIT